MPPDEQFEGALREACTRLGVTVVAWDGECADLLGRLEGKVALDDVRAACALEPAARWPALVQEALQGLALAVEARVDLSDAEALLPALRTRAYAEGQLLADDVVRRPLADGLVEVLVADIAGTVRTLSPAVVAAWGRDPAALLDLGRRQVLDGPPPLGRTVDLGGAQVLALESPSAFTATHVHVLPAYADLTADGALVALPTRHLLLVAPLRTRQGALDAAQALLVNAELLWQQGPGALSPDLWWWRDGALVLLPGTPTSLSPPAAFLEVLDALPG